MKPGRLWPGSMADLVSPCAFFQQPATLRTFDPRRQRAANAPAPCASAGWRAALPPAGACARRRLFSVDLPFRSSSIPDRRISRLRFRMATILAWPCHERAESRFRAVDRQRRSPQTNSMRRGKNRMRRFGFFLALRLPVRYGRSAAIAGCGSSVVEHSLGKGEVESSILSRSTSTFPGTVGRTRLTMVWRQSMAMPRL